MMCDPQQLYAYLEGDLGVAESAQVEAHLGECPNCVEQMASFQSVLKELDGLFPVATTAGIEEQVIERTYEDLTTTFSDWQERRRTLLIVGGLGASTIVLLEAQAVTDPFWQSLTGLQAMWNLVWVVSTLLIKGLGLVIATLFLTLAESINGGLLLSILLVLLLSPALSKLVPFRPFQIDRT